MKRPIAGAVNITVLDVYTGQAGSWCIRHAWPGSVDAAERLHGRQGHGNPFDKGPDRAGHGDRIPIDYTTNSLVGTSAENITFFIEPLIREIPDTGNRE